MAACRKLARISQIIGTRSSVGKERSVDCCAVVLEISEVSMKWRIGRWQRRPKQRRTSVRGMSFTVKQMPQPRPLRAEDGPLVFVDLEMTGLEFKRDVILEVAIIITNGDLERVDQPFSYVIRTEKKRLDEMDEWCTKTHGESGLTKACIESPYSHEWVEAKALEYIKKWVPEKWTGVLAGSSVHADRAFLVEHMPSITEWLHYRIVDVSTVKELNKRWYPHISRKPEDYPSNGVQHRALDDIQASIRELQWYRENIFIQPEAPQGTREATGPSTLSS